MGAREDAEQARLTALFGVEPTPLLSALDEVELGFAMEAGVLAGERLGSGVVDPVLAAELRALVRAGEAAFSRMVLSNLRLVHFWAHKRQLGGGDGGLDLADLVSAGTLGLIRAVHKWDYTLGYKLSTYASHWIKNFLQRAALSNTALTISHDMLERLRQVDRARAELQVTLSRQPTVVELAADTGLPVRAVRELLAVQRHAGSLDRPVDRGAYAPQGGGSSTVGDLVADTGPGTADVVCDGALPAELGVLLAGLSARHQRVLRLRFGLDGGAPLGVAEVARLVGVSEVLVRQALDQALAALRGASSIEDLRVYLVAA